MRANKSPPIPHVSGATIPCTIFTAIAASIALPPISKIFFPAFVDK